MKYIEILEAFETEIGVINNIKKPLTTDSLFWLNQAVSKFVKLRFNGDFVHKTSYEQNEKRRNDLINLYKNTVYKRFDSIDNTNVKFDRYELTYPEDFLFVLDENTLITGIINSDMHYTGVFECTSDSFMYRVNNSLTDFHYKYGVARPIRIRTATGCALLTDKQYQILEYSLSYLREPNKITLDSPFDEYTDFDNITMCEIIKIAAQMYLENTGSQRYNSMTQEVMTQE